MSINIRAGVGGVYNFTITDAPAYTRLQTFINDTDYSELVAPDLEDGYTGYAGQDLTTDRDGRVSGKLILINTFSLSTGSEINVNFYDPAREQSVAKFTIKGTGSIADTSVDSTRPSTLVTTNISSGTSSVAATSVADASKLGSTIPTLTPLMQTFFVDATRYPNGLFLSSVDIWFAKKDANAPVSIQLRKVIGGVPVSNEVIPGSICVKPAANVNVPANPVITTALSDQDKTKFPIFSKLLPGEYAICILTNSKEYSIYYSVFGEPGPGAMGPANKEPYIGRLYKSQNVDTLLEEKDKCLCFLANKAVFNKGTAFFELQNEAIPETLYDTVLLDSSTTGEGAVSGISYSINTVNELSAPGNLSGAVAINQNSSTVLDRRKKAIAKGDIKIGVTFTNDSADVSPVLDKSRLSLYTFANEINSPFDQDTRDSEVSPTGGVASSRYISKVVTLASGFDSTGLEVRLDVNRKYGTDIDVFCRVKSALDVNTDNTIDNLPWRRMPLYNQNATVTAPDSLEGKKSYAGYSEDFFTEVYKILETDSVATTGFANLEYQTLVGETLTTFKEFNKFQIKVVFYSDDKTIVPKIRNLIATAVV